jgi:hypothetical protein
VNARPPCACHGWMITLRVTGWSLQRRIRMFRILGPAPLRIKVGAALGIPIHQEVGEVRAREWADTAAKAGLALDVRQL